MKKLSDYRIREENGEITIEKETDIYVLGFKKREKKFVQTDFKGKCCLDMDFSNKVGKYPSVEAAKAQIIKWCEDPKYHYVKECDCGLCFSDEAFMKYDALFLGNYAKCFSDEKNKIVEKEQDEIRDERLNILRCDLIEENRKLKKEIEIIRYNSENVIKSYINEIKQLKAKIKK